MYRSLAAGLAAAVAAIALPVAASGHGQTGPCLIPAGWYANPDEQTRLPEPTQRGLRFSGTDLIHHATSGTVETLNPGAFAARPAPDQPSFFSVEVSGTDGGYATLRFNTTTGKWDMTTGGQFYTNTNPALLVDMVTPHKSHHVVSFGVGYTNTPPGTVTTTVSKVTFAAKRYSLACDRPKPSHSPSHTPSHSTSPSASHSASASPSASASVSASASTSASASASASTSATANASPSTSTSPSATGGVAGGPATTSPAPSTSPVASTGGLPLTGIDGRVLGIIAGALLAAGAGTVLLARRRRTRFTT